LEGLLWKSGNHPSFSVEHEGEAKPPGLNILKGYYDKGYAARYTEERSAIEQHGELLYAPLGTLTKLKAGKLKHRILQDLRRGKQNLLAELFERIVLPRPTDHAWDLYDLWVTLARGLLPEDSWIWHVVVDYKDAFMSTGTRADEQRFTAARVNDPDSPTGCTSICGRLLASVVSPSR